MSWKDLHFSDYVGPDGALYYTGVGARITPFNVCQEMVGIAQSLRRSGYCLRSGLAKRGADVAFKLGSGDLNQIFDPNGVNYPIAPEAFGIAQRHHAGWDRLDEYARKLMARNVHACLGPDLLRPSEFLICWTVDGCNSSYTRSRQSGGTGHTISVAEEFKIPRYNLNVPADYKKIKDILMQDMDS